MSEECPVCRSEENTSLGSLGRVEYFRCRSCGITYSTHYTGDDVRVEHEVPGLPVNIEEETNQ